VIDRVDGALDEAWFCEAPWPCAQSMPRRLSIAIGRSIEDSAGNWFGPEVGIPVDTGLEPGVDEAVAPASAAADGVRDR